MICDDEAIGQAKKKGGVYTVQAEVLSTSRASGSTRPGTYYWQAYRIQCENGNIDDCLQEGPVVKFKVG